MVDASNRHMPFLTPGRGGGTPYNGLYWEVPSERGTFFTNLVPRGFSPAWGGEKALGTRLLFYASGIWKRRDFTSPSIYEREEKSVIHYELFKRAFHWNNTNTHTVWLEGIRKRYLISGALRVNSPWNEAEWADWPVTLEGEASNCFSITQLVGQKRQ